jgi:hypothetical protein
LERFEAEGDSFLGRIFTGDETWVHYHQLETKKASEEWHHTSSPKPKKFCTQSSAKKVTLTLFWDKQGVILEDYMPRENPVTSTTYADLLKNNLLPSVKSKRRGRLNTGVLFQCDNARSHTASSTAATIQDCPLSVFHIPHTCQTSQPATFMFLDHSKR